MIPVAFVAGAAFAFTVTFTAAAAVVALLTRLAQDAEVDEQAERLVVETEAYLAEWAK